MVRDKTARMDRLQERRIDALRARLERHAQVLASVPRRMNQARMLGGERIVALARRNEVAVTQMLGRHRRGLAAQARMLQSLSYRSVLGRGFAVVRDQDRTLVAHAAEVHSGTMLSIEFADGEVSALASSAGASAPQPRKQARAKSGKPGEPGQGSLF